MRSVYRQLTVKDKELVEEVKTIARHMYGLLQGIGDSRELSIAKTKLEESVMWAVKHITG